MSEDGDNNEPNGDDAAAVAAALEAGENSQNDNNNESAWSYAEGVTGEGDAPDWFKADKYSSISDQAKAYKELEGKLGSFTGSPEEFTVTLDEALTEKGIEITTDDPLYDEASKFAKESNMSQEGFNGLMNLYAMSKVAENEAIEQHRTDEIEKLGQNAQGRIDNINSWVTANLPADLVEGFQEMATSAESIKVMERLVSMTRPGQVAANEAPAAPSMSSEELQKMQFEKDEHGNRRIATDTEFRKRYEALKLQVWGAEEHRQQIS